jgi:hypothetical protein
MESRENKEITLNKETTSTCQCEGMHTSYTFKSWPDYHGLLSRLESAESFVEEDDGPKYSNVGDFSRWWRCSNCKRLWRSTEPDPPFSGVWQVLPLENFEAEFHAFAEFLKSGFSDVGYTDISSEGAAVQFAKNNPLPLLKQILEEGQALLQKDDHYLQPMGAHAMLNHRLQSGAEMRNWLAGILDILKQQIMNEA